MANENLLVAHCYGRGESCSWHSRRSAYSRRRESVQRGTVLFVGAVLSVLGDKLVDAYLHIRDAKELWDALDSKFGAADAGGELYAME